MRGLALPLSTRRAGAQGSQTSTHAQSMHFAFVILVAQGGALGESAQDSHTHLSLSVASATSLPPYSTRSRMISTWFIWAAEKMSCKGGRGVCQLHAQPYFLWRPQDGRASQEKGGSCNLWSSRLQETSPDATSMNVQGLSMWAGAALASVATS